MKEAIANVQENSSQEEEFMCEKCQNTGWILIRENGKDFAKECPCGIRQKEIMNSKLKFASIPEAFKDYSLKDFKLSVYKNSESREIVKTSCEAVKYWLDNLDEMEAKGKGLYIFSDVKGSGKTRLVTSLANDLIKEHKKLVKFATSVQILQEIRASWDKDDESENRLIEDLCRADYLIIDDFGTEAPKEWIQDRFYSIINSRYVDKKPTIFTSNYSLEDIKYDARITNRITEMCFELPFAEESVREHISKESEEKFWRGVMNNDRQN